MRDGKFLAADLYLPSGNGNFPVILIQTPYNKNTYRQAGLPLGIRYNLASSEYAFVILDWRGFYGSSNSFSTNTNKGEDGFDAVEWIASQNWSNGKVGTWGPSALSNVQFETAYEQPPHLICAVPQVTMPQTRYDDYYPGGCLEVASLQTLGVLFGNGFSTVINNPHYNTIWQYVENSTLNLSKINIPMLLVAGWYDHNIDFDIKLIQWLREQSDVSFRAEHKILIGPWVHGGTGQAYVGSSVQGELSYPIAEGANRLYEKQFFDYYMLNASNSWSENAFMRYYQMGEGVWFDVDNYAELNDSLVLYANVNTKLEESVNSEALLDLSYNPEDPSPTIGGKTLHPNLVQGPLNQQAIIDRNDALYFETSALPSDFRMFGRAKANIVIEADSKDTDLMARLVDVYPDGRKMLVDDDVLRMRFRDGFTTSDTSFMTVGEQYEAKIVFDATAITFKEGHKIGLIITHSNYPLYNRNMNTGAAMYPDGNIDTLLNPKSITSKLLIGANNGTRLKLPGQFLNSGVESIDKKTTFEDVSLWPNPVNDVLTIEVQKNVDITKVQVSNYRGEKVDEISLRQTKLNTTEIDCSNLAKGIYVVTVSTTLGVFVKHFIKE